MDQTFYTLSPKDLFERLLILGDTSNVYSVDRKDLDTQTVSSLAEQIKSEAISLIVDVSENSRAPKNDFAIYALAIIAAKNADLRSIALEAITKVCRTPTHLFMFLNKYKECNGKTGGRAFKRVLSHYYMLRSVDEVAYAAVKYRNRNGWSHRDVLRLLRPKANDPQRDLLFSWITGKTKEGVLPGVIQGYEETQKEGADIPALIRKYKLPFEALPNSLSKEAWTALLPTMGATALLRSLNRMAIAGVEHDLIVQKLNNQEYLNKSRIHPIQVLTALKIYSSGKGDKGSLTWTPDDRVKSALEEAFVASFKQLPRTTKRLYVGVDISPSMEYQGVVGTPSLQPLDVAAAMGTVWSYQGATVKGFANVLLDLNDLYDLGMNAAMTKLRNAAYYFVSTDLSLIIKDAMERKQVVDAFIVITDNDINSGENVNDMILRYRRDFNPGMKVVVMATSSTDITIGDPKDPLILNLSGFDSSAPQIIDNFLQ